MNQKIKRTCGGIITALAFTAIGVAWADSTSQCVPFTLRSGGSGSGCPGAYIGFAKMTNITDGTAWIVPPTNAVTGTFTNASGFVGVTYVMRKKDSVTWCNTNSVTFPATNSTSYELMVYIKSAPVPTPTNNQPITLQVNWQ